MGVYSVYTTFPPDAMLEHAQRAGFNSQRDLRDCSGPGSCCCLSAFSVRRRHRRIKAKSYRCGFERSANDQ